MSDTDAAFAHVRLLQRGCVRVNAPGLK
jgi:hypothetical protein